VSLSVYITIALLFKYDLDDTLYRGIIYYVYTQMTKYAVLMGINYPGSSCPLNGCINDVLNVKKYITAECGYAESDVVVMTDNPRITRNENLIPTRDNIWRQLDTAVAKLRAGDTLFVHYSGHGTGIRDAPRNSPYSKAGDESDGQDECWCPVDSLDDDTRFIVDDELKERMVNRIPVGVRLRVVSDSCHSGSIIDSPRSFSRGKRLSQESLPYKQSDDVLAISGCMDSQTSSDAFISGVGQGALTWALLDTLKSCKGWTAREVVTAVRLKLHEGGYEQFPILSMGNKRLLDKKLEF